MTIKSISTISISSNSISLVFKTFVSIITSGYTMIYSLKSDFCSIRPLPFNIKGIPRPAITHLGISLLGIGRLHPKTSNAITYYFARHLP